MKVALASTRLADRVVWTGLIYQVESKLARNLLGLEKIWTNFMKFDEIWEVKKDIYVYIYLSKLTTIRLVVILYQKFSLKGYFLYQVIQLIYFNYYILYYLLILCFMRMVKPYLIIVFNIISSRIHCFLIQDKK